MNTHDAIVDAYVSLGYSADDKGCCQGTSLRWLEASFLNEEPLFHKRLLKLVAYGAHLKNALEAVKAKQGENLTREDNYLIEIQSFMDSLCIFQAPDEQQGLFNKRHVYQDNIDEVSTFASSEAIQRLGGLTKVYSQPLIYNEEEIANYLNDLATAIENHCPHPGKKVGILLSNYAHTMALTYTTGGGWCFMDINEYPPESLPRNNTRKLAKNIVDSLKEHDSPYIAFSTRAITVKNDPYLNSLTEQLTQLKAKHAVTPDLALREEQINLCFIAAYEGEAKIVEETARYGTNVEFTDKEGTTPVFIATLHGHDSVIEVLAKHNANLNVVDPNNGWTPMHYAVDEEHTKIITCLAQNHANLNIQAHNRFTPLQLAVSRGNVAAIAELIKFGADVSISMTCPVKDFKPKDALALQRFNTLVGQKLVVNDEILLTPQEMAFIDGKEQIVKLFRHANKINSLYQAVVAFEKYCETTQPPYVIIAARGLKEFTNEYICSLYSVTHAPGLEEWNNRYTKGMQFLTAQSQAPKYLDELNEINTQFKNLVTALHPMHSSPLKRKSLFSHDTPEEKRMKFTEHPLDENMDPNKGFN